MSLIHWSPLLSVGIDSIDTQHQQLIIIINNLNDSMEKGHADEILSNILDELTVYTKTHFVYEEKLFQEYDYPAGKYHANEHQTLIEHVELLKKKEENGELMLSLEIMNFLKEWITNHILKMDMAYASFLIKKGVK